MRKLALAMLLIGAVTLPIAAEITFGGDITFGAILDFADPETATDVDGVNGFNKQVIAGYAKTATIDVKATIDDNNYGLVALKHTAEATLLEEAYIRTNIFGALMAELPLTLTTWFGYTSASDASLVSTSEYGYENIGNAGTGTTWIVRADAVIPDLATIRFGWAPGTSIVIPGPLTTDDEQSAGNWIVGAFTTLPAMGDISFAAEVFYDNAAGDQIGDGDLIVDGEFKMTIGDIKLDIGAGIRLEMGDLDTATTEKETIMYYGAGVGFDYGTMFGVALGLLGPSLDGATATVNDTDAAIDLIGIDVTVDPIDLLDIRAAVRLSLDPEKTEVDSTTAQMFRGADVAAILNLGAVDIFLGYLVTTVGEGATWAPSPGTNSKDGGPYFKVDINY